MSGRSPNKLNSSQSSTSTSPRRIKPMCLFSHLLSPSPSKPLFSKGTPGSARRRLDISGLDSPSKNTRSHDNEAANNHSAQTTLPEFQSPFKSTSVKNSPFTPKKTAQFESLFAGRSFTASPTSGTPVRTPRRIQATSCSFSQPIDNLTRTPVKGILKTPGKQGPATPLRDHALSVSELMMSPNRLTRRQVKSIMFSSSEPNPQFQQNPNSTLMSNSSVKWEDECVEFNKTGETDDSVFVSPSKSAAECTPSPENRPVTPNEQCPNVLQTPTRPGKENCLTPNNSRKRVKTPDSLDKWPRRKRRSTINSPPKKLATSCSPEQTESGLQQDLPNEDSSKVVKTPVKSPKSMTVDDDQSSGKAVSCTPKKRKRELTGGIEDVLASKALPSSPFKRFKLAALESRMSGSGGGSTEYFDSTDVFLGASDVAQKTSSRIVPRVISGCSDGGSLQMSEPPSSPVFPMASHLMTRQGSSQDAWNDQDSRGSLSPVFQRKLSNLIGTLESDSENSPKKPSRPNSPVVGSPAMNYRKFSPNVSAKSLSHLMMSPLISDKKSSGSPQKTAGQKNPTKNTAKHSRRSLYQSQP